MNITQAIRQIRLHRPRTPEQFTTAGVPLEKRAIGSGVFREVVKVAGLPLVVKFPLNEGRALNPNYREGIAHSQSEVRKINRLKKLRWMRKYLPKVYYYERASGVLVMHWYPSFNENTCDFEDATARFVGVLFRHATGTSMIDYHSGNACRGVDNQGDTYPVLIDFGY